MSESRRDRTFVTLSGREASAHVGHPLQAQARRDLSESLPTGRKEAAEETAFSQFLQPHLPRLRSRAQPLEHAWTNCRHLRREYEPGRMG